jgi:hypothetical protein
MQGSKPCALPLGDTPSIVGLFGAFTSLRQRWLFCNYWLFLSTVFKIIFLLFFDFYQEKSVLNTF